MFKNKDFASSLDTNTFYFNHFNFNNFTPYNGRHIPSEGLPLDMIHEKTSLFEGSGIGNSKAVLQVTRRMIIARYFMLLFDLTPDRAASEGHISLPDQGNIRLDLRFEKPLSEAITCLLYLEYDNCVRIDQLALFPQTFNNGHGTDTLYATGRAFISRRLSVRHSASFYNTLRDSYRKYRSTHG